MTHEDRVWHHEMETCEGIHEHAERIASLEELVLALLTCATDGECDECRINGASPCHVGEEQLCDGVYDRMRELGIEVDE